MRRGGARGVIRMALLFAAFLASLSLVVWRQSRALDVLRELDRVRRERAVVEARRASVVRELDVLEGRGRITRLVAERGMRVPRGDEIVLLPLDVATRYRVGPPGVVADAGARRAERRGPPGPGFTGGER